jgi:hypothetical protein
MGFALILKVWHRFGKSCSEPKTNTIMRNIIVSLALLLMSQLVMGHSVNPITIRSVTDGFIYFKIHKKMIGSTIEIRDESQNVLLSDKILEKRLIVDFYHKKPGKYTIQISNNEFELKFTYQNAYHPDAIIDESNVMNEIHVSHFKAIIN